MFAKFIPQMSEILVKLENISVSRNNEAVLSNFSLNLQQGEFLYLNGKIGSGKSSFLKTLYADLPLQSGRAEVVGFDLSSISRNDVPFLRRKLGIVFQDYKLLQDRSVFDNLKFAAEAAGNTNSKRIKSAISDCLNLVGLSDKAQRMPFELSGGEQQLACIARALLNDPKLMLADEPTGNLDSETSDKIMQVLHNQTKNGKAVIMATHNAELVAKYAGQVLQFG